MMRSIFTPAHDALYKRLDSLRLGEGVHLRDDVRFASGTGVIGLARQFCDHHFVHSEWGLHEAVQLRCLGEAGELQKQLVHVLPDLVVAGKEPVVGVLPGRAGMIVPGAEMAVAPDSAGLAPHDQRQLGVGLVADDAIHDVRAGLLQAIRQFDVGFFVEPRPQLDDHGDVLPGVGGGHQGIDDRRVVTRSI